MHLIENLLSEVVRLHAGEQLHRRGLLGARRTSITRWMGLGLEGSTRRPTLSHFSARFSGARRPWIPTQVSEE